MENRIEIITRGNDYELYNLELDIMYDILKEKGWIENMMEGSFTHPTNNKFIYHYNRSPYNGQFLYIGSLTSDILDEINEFKKELKARV